MISNSKPWIVTAVACLASSLSVHLANDSCQAQENVPTQDQLQLTGPLLNPEMAVNSVLAELKPGVSLVSHYLNRDDESNNGDSNLFNYSDDEAPNNLQLGTEFQDEDQDPAIKSWQRQWSFKKIEDVKFEMYSGSIIPSDRSPGLLNRISNGSTYLPPNAGTTAYWVAPNLCYQPLLFEDALLERYGKASTILGMQPYRSGVHFAISSILLPIKVFTTRHDVETPLAFDRPGSYTPSQRQIFLPGRR